MEAMVKIPSLSDAIEFMYIVSPALKTVVQSLDVEPGIVTPVVALNVSVFAGEPAAFLN